MPPLLYSDAVSLSVNTPASRHLGAPHGNFFGHPPGEAAWHQG
jgi:hypothetical protein